MQHSASEPLLMVVNKCLEARQMNNWTTIFPVNK